MTDHKYLTIKQIINSESYPFSEGQIRHFLIMRHKNGLIPFIINNETYS